MGDSPHVKRTLPQGPYIIGQMPAAGATVTVAPPDGMLNGKDILNVYVEVEFTDQHRQRCKAQVRAWTQDLVRVSAYTDRGHYVVWVPADQITRRFP